MKKPVSRSRSVVEKKKGSKKVSAPSESFCTK
jgi:hypothetical protein